MHNLFMNNSSCFFVASLMFLFSLSFVSSNFVCGTVNNHEGISPAWTNVIVYFEENISDFTDCKINPENKFCCDLENISSVEFGVGKKVFAEVFDKEKGIVGGPVSLYLTDTGYDVFPDMELEKAITPSLSEENLFINQSSISINLSLAENYNNLKYELTSSEGHLEEQVCNDCNNFEFLLPLFKGRNELVLISNSTREISENIVIYNLDYFNFNVEFSCDKCKLKKRFFYIPSEEEIKVTFSFNTSHNISGDFMIYFPYQWTLLNESDVLKLQDFSHTHKGFREQIINKKGFSIDYLVKSPRTFIKQDYLFYQKLNEYESLTKARIFKIKLIPFRKVNSFEKNYSDYVLEQRASPDEPIVLNSNESYLKLVAIFPKKEVINSYSDLDFNLKKSKTKIKKESSFKILTTIPQRDIDRIFLVFRAEKDKNIEVYSNNVQIPLKFYEEDTNFRYYSAYVKERGPFKVEIL